MKKVKTTARKGFTLIELLLVVALISALSMYLIPEFIKFNNRQSLISVSNELVSALQQTQNLASSGVQDEGNFVNEYRFSLKHHAADPADYYRGYEIMRVNESDIVVDPVLASEDFDCPVCINSDLQRIDYKVPTGNITNLSADELGLTVCSPDVGFYTVTVDKVGRIYNSGFSDEACTCALVSCP